VDRTLSRHRRDTRHAQKNYLEYLKNESSQETWSQKKDNIEMSLKQK
jgi:hypothetical protein